MLTFCQVSDWVEPSFTDFCKSTSASSNLLHVKTATDTYHCQKRKEHFLPKTERKKKQPHPTDESYKPSKQSQGQTEPWVDKYKPQTQVKK